MTKQKSFETYADIFSVKDQSVVDVPFEVLKNSGNMYSSNRAKKTRMLNAFELIDDIRELCDKQKIDLLPEKISVIERATTRMVAPKTPLNEVNINQIYFGTVLCTFMLNTSNKDRNTMIGLSYHDKGVSVAFGTNLKVCSNLCIMGQRDQFQTWGNNSETWDGFIARIEKHIQALPGLDERNWNIIKSLRAIEADRTDFEQIIGQEFIRTHQARERSSNDFIFDISQLGVIAKSENVVNINTANDIYQLGTFVMKPEYKHEESIHQANVMWGQRIFDKYNIEVAEIVPN